MYPSFQKGFTLIEIILVMGLIGIILSFGVAMSIGSISQSTVTQERDLFVTLLLRGARAAAIANVGQTAHSVYIDSANHKYILFDGTTYTSGASTNREVPFTNDNIVVTNTGGNKIIFDQLSGNVSEGAGTISITNGNATQEIIVREVGQIDW